MLPKYSEAYDVVGGDNGWKDVETEVDDVSLDDDWHCLHPELSRCLEKWWDVESEVRRKAVIVTLCFPGNMN